GGRHPRSFGLLPRKRHNGGPVRKNTSEQCRIRTDRGGDVVPNPGDELEIPARVADPDRHIIAGEELTKSAAEPVENCLKLHNLVELTHEVDQRSGLAVAALQASVRDR